MTPVYGPCGRHSPPRDGQTCWCCEMLKPFEEMLEWMLERATAGIDPSDRRSVATAHRHYHEWSAPIITEMAKIASLDAPVAFIARKESDA